MIKILQLSTLLLIQAFWPTQTGSAQDWIPLFNGKNLDGWKASEDPKSFRAKDGMIVCDGPRSHLFYAGNVRKADFRNFEFKAEVMTRPGANSGIYFHTRYQDSGWPEKGFEVQVNNTHRGAGDYRERKKTASLYAIRNVYKQLVPDDRWFALRFMIEDRRIRVWLNGMLTVDYIEPPIPFRTTEHKGSLLSSGTFALQCHDPNSIVCFRDLFVRPLPDSLVTDPPVIPLSDDSTLARLASENFPLVDYHVHLKGGLTLEKALEKSRSSGIFYGIAPNCGMGFPIRNDAGIDSFLNVMKGVPAFLGMQAEGREWVRMFSRDEIQKFDYVFTDGMTFTDQRGKRVRLWIPGEYEVGDKQAFMDMLTDRIAGILENEPIDVYVNPTYLPAEIAGEYDSLWTEARMRRVVNAAAKRGIAVEINERFRIPSLKFIHMAKNAGVKFTFGSNNTDDHFGSYDYCLRMVRECGITGDDMFVPKRDRVEYKDGRIVITFRPQTATFFKMAAVFESPSESSGPFSLPSRRNPWAAF
jgi:hypothetical protein